VKRQIADLAALQIRSLTSFVGLLLGVYVYEPTDHKFGLLKVP